MATPSAPFPITSRSIAEVQRDIDRVSADLRELRTRQSHADMWDRPKIALTIDAAQTRLDQLYEEKRAAEALAIRSHRSARRDREATSRGIAVSDIFADGAMPDKESAI